jgi:arylsulfatase B
MVVSRPVHSLSLSSLLAGVALLAVALDTTAAVSPPPRPHVLVMLADDWGWGNWGAHRVPGGPGSDEVVTPNLDNLAQQGMVLDRAYSFKYCSPSRCALQTGRNPIHVNVLNTHISQMNPADPVSGFQGIPLNMTGIANKLLTAGYRTHQRGKWNAGMAHMRQTPRGRGYESSLSYFDYDTWYFNDSSPSGPSLCNKSGAVVVDLWAGVDGGGEGPALGQNNSLACSQSNQAPGCLYQDELFVRQVIDIISTHNATEGPLFLVWTPHAPHDPYDVPNDYLAKFASVNQTQRREYLAMVNLLDDNAGRVEQAFKAAGLWDSLLWITMSDNGGPVSTGYGGSSWPLRGGKASNLEGGVRSNAFVTGGFIPAALRNTSTNGLIGIEDWYTTLCSLAGVDPTDEEAAAAGLPPVDGLDMSGLLLGTNMTSPRTEIVMGSSTNPNIMANGATVVQGVLRADGYKLLVGTLSPGTWQGPIYPNASGHSDAALECGDPAVAEGKPGAGTGCLFNVFSDPHETTNVAAQFPEIVADLRARIAVHNATVFSPERGPDDLLACETAQARWGGFWGPFVF